MSSRKQYINYLYSKIYNVFISLLTFVGGIKVNIYDFYLGTGTSEGRFVLPNFMYVGQANSDATVTGHMDNIAMLFDFGTIQKRHGIDFFNFNNDGDEDIYFSLGGMRPGDKWPNQLFLNESQSNNNWVKIRLKGSIN